MIIQRFGRCLRRTADPEKVGTLALPCTDPYEPDEDQLLEWERICVDVDTIKQDRAAELARGFDLTCKVAECMLDPSISAMGRLFSVVTGQQKDSKSRGSGSADKAESLLRMMVSINNEPPRTLLLEDADVALFYDLASIAGRKLVVLTDEEWLALAERWKVSQSNLLETDPLFCRNGWPPANGHRRYYRDSEFGTVNFGGWVNSQRTIAKDAKNHADQKVAETVLDSLGKVLGFESGWWKGEKRIKTAVAMPQDVEECLQILKRWRAIEQKKDKPRDVPAQSGLLSEFDDDESGVVWSLGKWLNNKINDAKGSRGKNKEVQTASTDLLERVAIVLEIPVRQEKNDLYWWGKPENSAQPMPRDWESQRRIIEHWRAEEAKKAEPAAYPNQSAVIDDPKDGIMRKIGSWLTTQMQKARNAYNANIDSFTGTQEYKNICKVGQALGLPDRNPDGKFWWESTVTHLSNSARCSIVAGWWQQNPGSTSYLERGQAGGLQYGPALTALKNLKTEEQESSDAKIIDILNDAGWTGTPWPGLSEFTPVAASGSKTATKKNDEDEWCRKAVLFWCDRNKDASKKCVTQFKERAIVKDVDCGLGLRGLKKLLPEGKERIDSKIRNLISNKPEWKGHEWPGIASLEEIATTSLETLVPKYEHLAAFWWHNRGAAAVENSFGPRDSIRLPNCSKDEPVGAALIALKKSKSKENSDKAIKERLKTMGHTGRAWPGLENLTLKK